MFLTCGLFSGGVDEGGVLIARPVEPMSYRISHPQTFSSVILWLQLAPHCVWVAALRVRWFGQQVKPFPMEPEFIEAIVPLSH